MISIVLVIGAVAIFLLKHYGVVKANPLVVFLIFAIIVGVLSFVLKGKLNCPFVKKCPFAICPLNKTE